MAEAGAAIVVADAELTPERLAAEAGALLADPARLERDGGGLARRWPGPTRPSGSPTEVLAAAGTRDACDGAMSDWTGRELHFIAIGGAGMSGARAGLRTGSAPRVTGSDRAESSYHASGCATPASSRRRPRRGRGARRAPRWSSRPRSARTTRSWPAPASAASGCIHRGELLAELCAERRLIAVAGTHGKTTTAGMLAHGLRETGADPAFLLGGELPGRRARRRGGQRRLGGGRVDRRRGRRERRAASSSFGPRSRSSPTSSSTTTRAGARAPSCSTPSASFAEPGRRGWRPATGVRPRRARASGRTALASTPSAPARRSRSRSRAATTCSTRAPRSRRSSSPGSTSSRSPRRRSPSFPGMRRRLELKGPRRRRRRLRRLRPPSDRGARPRSPPCASSARGA